MIIKAIDISVGTVKYERSKLLTWISIKNKKPVSSGSPFFYISWPTGRMYFRTTSDEFKKTIRNVMFDDTKCTLYFTWVGKWETNSFGSTGNTKNVKKNVKIKFDKKSEYQYLKRK